ITLYGIDDFLDDGDQNFTIKTLSATSSDPKYSGADPADIAVTTKDDDERGIVLDPASGFQVAEGSTSTYAVSLASQPSAGATVIVSLTIASGTDEISSDTSSIDFDDSNWNIPVTVTITGTDDTTIDGGDDASIDHTATGDSYGTAEDITLAVDVIDSNTPEVFITPASIDINETSTGTVTLSLSAEPSDTVTIALVSADTGVATAPATVTIGTTEWTGKTVTITAPPDANSVDDSTTIAISIAGSNAATEFDAALLPADLIVWSRDSGAAKMTTATTGLSFDESDATSQTYQVSLSQAPGSGEVVVFSVSAPGGQVTVSPQTLVYSDTDASAKTITVTVVDDGKDEAATHVDVIDHKIIASSVPGIYPVNNVLLSVPIDVADNDTRGIVVNPLGGLLTTESGTTASFSVRLASQPADNVTVTLSSNKPTEATVAPSPLTFTASDWQIAQSVTVTGQDDGGLDDGDQSFVISGTVDQANISGQAYDLVSFPSVAGTNQDDDEIGVAITVTDSTAEETGGITASYEIVLRSKPSAAVQVAIAPDGQVKTWESSVTTEISTIWFSPTKNAGGTGLGAGSPKGWNEPFTVMVTAVDDDRAEELVHPGNITHAVTGGDYTGAAATTVTIDCTDNDTAGVTVGSINTTIPEDLGASVVVLSEDVTGTAITIKSGDLSTAFVGQLIVFADGGPNAGFITSITNIAGNVLTVADAPTATAIDENIGLVAGFTVVLKSRPLAPVSITWVSEDDTEAYTTPNEIIFTQADNDWDRPRVISVVAENDDIDDGPQTFDIVPISVVSLDPKYSGLPLTPVSVTVTDDDDDRGWTFVGETGLQTTEIGGTDSFTLALTTEPTGTVTVSFASLDADQGSVDPSSVVFTSDNWYTPQTVVVTGADGDDADNTPAGIDWTLDLSNDTLSGIDYFALAIADLTINNKAVNHAPTIDTPSPQAVAEDATATVVNLTGIGSGQTGESQTLAVSAFSSDPALIPDPVIAYTSANTTGTLTFTPIANSSGSATITITLSDNGGTADGGIDSTEISFPITVSSVNDAPTLDLDASAAGTGYTTTYDENDPAVPLADATDVAITDVDSSTAISATATLTVRPDGTDEVLDADLSSFPGVVKDFNATTGVLILTATDPLPLSDWEDIVALISYRNTSNDPNSVTPRTIAITVNDGSSSSTAATATVTVNAIAFAPAIDLVSTTASYQEDDGAKVITSPSLTITDDDSTNLSQVTVAITNQLDGANESLAVSVGTTGINASFAGTTLTLDGTTTRADYAQVLRTLTYTNSSQNPDATDRVIRFVATDAGGTSSANADLTLSVSPVNDAPVVTLNTGSSVAIDGIIPINQTHIDASDEESNNDTLTFELLLVPSRGDLIHATNGTLLLGDSFTRADLVAGNITYDHGGFTADPDGFAFRVSDSVDESDLEVFNITVTGLASPQVVLPNRTTDLIYTEGDAAIKIDAAATATDTDSPNFAGGNVTATISGTSDPNDVLSLSTAFGVTIDASNNVIRGGTTLGTVAGGTSNSPLVVALNINASAEQVENIVRSIQFHSATNNPTSGTRTVTIIANDGSTDSDPTTAARDIQFVLVNDPPTVVVPPVVVIPAQAKDFQLTISDPESNAWTATVTQPPGKGTLPAFNTGTGAFTYESFIGIAGFDTFRVEVNDGFGITTVDVAVTIAGAGLSSLRFANNPPFQVDENGFLLYQPQLAGVASGATLSYELVAITPGIGNAANLVFVGATGTVTWSNVPKPSGDHYLFGIMVTDTTNRQAAYLPITLTVVTPPVGGG
ncbi:MAG: hypothetical protein PF961_11750, partial [Planctomycetota bacterium]|nr:hypothetical protein [Planctomycetota bacterium]